MEVALAVITLTTAVKDIVELGQKIHESFVKTQVPDNFRNLNAQRVAEDIKEMVGEINAFCDIHKGTLDDMKDFYVALLGFLGKFRSFEASVLPLLLQSGGRRRDRFIRGWNAWRNNNSIERKISDLQSDIVAIMRRFVWKSAMRAEVKLETIHQETSRGLEALEDVRRDVYALRITAAAAATQGPFEPSGATGDGFNRNIILFAKSTPSTSVPMLRTPDVITEELMTAAYIKFQINAIATTIARMSMLPLNNATSANGVVHFWIVGPLEELSMNITHLRHHIVRRVTAIRDLLADEHMHTISIYDGSVALNNLASGLDVLDMKHEALLVGKWAIMLASIVGGTCDGGRHDFNAALAFFQCNESQRYRYSGDMTQALQSIEEAYKISQKLRNQFRTEVDSTFHLLHAIVLWRRAELQADCGQSIRMLVEAITIFESIVGVNAFSYCEVDDNISLVVRPSSFFFDKLFSSSSTTTIHQYASSLRLLGFKLLVGGHHKGALDLLRLAVTVYQKFVSIHGPEHNVHVAETLLSLVNGEAASHIPADELVTMADECIQLLRLLAKNNPSRYAHKLFDILSAKASTHARLNQDNEAITAWEEAASIAEQIVQDSNMRANVLRHLSDHFRRLGRYNDAVRTGKLAITTYQDADGFSQAMGYLYLSKDLQKLRRYNEAVEAARTSVTLHRRLIMMTDPSQCTACFAWSLCGLAYGLAALRDTPGVLIAWREFTSILDNVLNANSDTSHTLIPAYCCILEEYTLISPLLKNKEDCHHVGSTAFRYCQQLAQIHVQYKEVFYDLSSAQWYCAYTLFLIGCLQEADQYVDHWVNIWSGKLAIVEHGMWWHTVMIKLKSRVLHMQGCTEEALLATQKSRNFPSLSASAHLLVCSQIITSMTFEAQIQVDLGHTKEALQIAKEALQISRDNQQELPSTPFVRSLHAVAFTTLLCGNYALSIEAAQEGSNFCASSSRHWQDHEDELNSSLRPSLLAILSSAEANLGRCGAAVEYARRAVAASLDIGEKWNVSAMTAEASYMETRGNLAEVLLATGDVVTARQICEQRRAYFSERVEKRMGEYRDLAPILRMLGILCCAEGHHEDGEAAAQELSEIMKKLGCAFPSLQEQVKIRLRRQANMPILKVLDDMTQKLDCKHQVKVSSLCEIQSTS